MTITVRLPNELARQLLDRRPSAIADSAAGWAAFQAALRQGLGEQAGADAGIVESRGAEDKAPAHARPSSDGLNAKTAKGFARTFVQQRREAMERLDDE